MQYPGTTPSGTFGGAAGATTMANQLTPQGLEGRKQALIQRLAAGQAARTAFPSSPMGGGFGGSLMNAFASSFFGGGQGGNQFYGQNGVGTPSTPADNMGSHAGAISTGLDSASGQQGVAAAPPTSVGIDGGGVMGGYNPMAGVDPVWLTAMANIYGGGITSGQMRAS